MDASHGIARNSDEKVLDLADGKRLLIKKRKDKRFAYAYRLLAKTRKEKHELLKFVRKICFLCNDR